MTTYTVDPSDVSTPDVRIHIAGTTPGESADTKALIETVANTPEAFLAQQVVTLGPSADEITLAAQAAEEANNGTD